MTDIADAFLDLALSRVVDQQAATLAAVPRGEPVRVYLARTDASNRVIVGGGDPVQMPYLMLPSPSSTVAVLSAGAGCTFVLGTIGGLA